MLLSVLILLLVPLIEVALSTNCHRALQPLNHKIIDISASTERGAKLIKGIEAASYEDCLDQCCSHSKCDLALYRTLGVSNVGHNCYFIHCGNKANCITADHNEFITVFLGHYNNGYHNNYHGHSYGEDIDSHDDTDHYKNHQRPSTIGGGREHALYISTTSTYSATVTATATPSTTSSNLTTASSTVIIIASSPVMASFSVHVKNEITGTSSIGVDAINVTSSLSSSIGASVAPDDGIINPKENHNNGDKDPIINDANCQTYPCFGLIIAGVVVLLIVITVFIALIIVKKIYTNRKQKYYHNVDYLINGMYF